MEGKAASKRDREAGSDRESAGSISVPPSTSGWLWRLGGEVFLIDF